MIRPVVLSVLLGCAALACDSGDTGRSAPLPSSTVKAPAEPPAPPPTAKTTVTFEASDGAALAGDWYLAGETAPTVILVHRLHADRSELQPLAERLARTKRRFNVLAFDLAGHGASKLPEKTKPPGVERMREDVKAAIAEVDRATKGKTSAIVLVGSSLGATLVSQVAFDEPQVSALALISPGAAISGLDVYAPYAEVRNLPTFLAGAEGDPVSRDPLDALAKMAQAATVKRYPGSRHSAGLLAEEHSALWGDLEQWLASVFDEKPSERRSLKYAPGKEPKARKGGAR